MGSSKKQTVGYQYFLGQHQILCHGPVDFMSRYTVDDRMAWQGLSSGSTISVNAPSLFGGEGREGGVSGPMDIEMGGPEQGPNAYLVSKLGGLVPAFRGVVGVVQKQMYLGNNPYLKKNAFRLQRIYVRQDGVAQWYMPRAAIGDPPQPMSIYLACDRSGSMAELTSNGQTRMENMKTAIASVLDLLSSLAVDQNIHIDIDLAMWSDGLSDNKRYNADGDDFDDLQAILAAQGASGGTDFAVGLGQLSDFFAAATGTTKLAFLVTDGAPSAGMPNAVAARAILDAVPGVKLFAINIDLVDISYTSVVDSTPEDGVPVVSGGDPSALTNAIFSAITSGGRDMNPSHMIRECLTDPIWGMGYNEDDIYDVSFMSAADQLWAEGMGMSLLWDRQMPIEQFVQEVIKHINGALYVGRRGPEAGKFVLKLIRGNYEVEDLPVFDESNIEKMEGFKRVEIGELTNSVTANFWDSATGKTASTTAQDPALVQQQGAVINTTMQYPGFTKRELADRVALRDLQTLSTPLASCTIYTNTDAKDLNIADVIAVSWEDYGLILLPMRIISMVLGDGKTNKIKIVLTQDTFALPEQGVIVPPDTGWEDPSQPPVPMVRQYAEELPYFEIVQQSGQNVVDAKLATDPDTGFVGTAGSSPQTGAINARIMSDDGSGYEDVGAIDFCPSALLEEAVDEFATEFELKNTLDLAGVAAGEYAKIGDEYIGVESIAGTTLTAKRGVLDTVPQQHAVDAVMFFSDPLIQADPTEYVASDVVAIKLLTVAGQGQLPLDQALELPVTLSSRAVRPYPPGNVKINGEYEPTVTVEGEFEITLAHRNRIQQTGGALVGWYDGSVTSEAGVEYEARVYDPTSGDLLFTSDRWTTDSTLIELAITQEIRLAVYSLRDEYECWQAPSVTFEYAAAIPVISGDAPSAINGEPYSFTYGVIGSVGPYTWAISTGALPPGITLDPDTGELSGDGTGMTDGAYSWEVSATSSTSAVGYKPDEMDVITPIAEAVSLLSKVTDYWDLSEASGAFVNSKSARNLTRGSGIGTRTGPAGGADVAADFDPAQGIARAPDAGSFKGGDRDFAMWGWCRVDSTGATRIIMSDWSAQGVNSEWSPYAYSGGMGLQFQDNTDTSRFFDFSAVVPTNWTFFYIEQNRATGKIEGRINGSPTGVQWSGTGYMRVKTTEFRVSGLGDSGGSDGFKYDGGISRIGFSAGTRLTDAEQAYLYNSGVGKTWAEIYEDAGQLAIPTGDPDWKKVSCLLNLKGADGLTRFYDGTGNLFTLSGNAHIDTGDASFPDGALLLDGNNDWIQTVKSLDGFKFGNGDFSIQCKFKTSDATSYTLLDFYQTGIPGGWQVFGETSGAISFYKSTAGAAALVATTTVTGLSDGNVHDVEINRVSGVLKIYIDGVEQASVADATNYNGAVSTFAVGAQVASRNAAYDFVGWISRVRVTKGAARHTAAFTPDTDSFPNY